MAYFNSTSIPANLLQLKLHGKGIWKMLSSQRDVAIKITEAMNQLRDFSMISVDSTTSLSVPTIIQKVVRDTLERKQEDEGVLNSAIDLITVSLQKQSVEFNEEICKSHAIGIAGRIPPRMSHTKKVQSFLKLIAQNNTTKY